MVTRMLCTECLHLGAPDTALDGSDRAELLLWCCLVVPGLLYCWWRHLQRRKVCPQCGSDALMRESRAAAARRPPQALPAAGARVFSPGAPAFAWPHPLGSPRARLRSGGVGALLLVLCLGAALLAPLEIASEARALHAANLGALLCASWLARQVQQIARLRTGLGDCQAWDEQGRVLRIERI